jgi:hypothetical protein
VRVLALLAVVVVEQGSSVPCNSCNSNKKGKTPRNNRGCFLLLPPFR